MNFAELLKKSERVIASNSPLILTGIGVAGTITSAVLAGKASFRAAELIRQVENLRFREDTEAHLEPKEKFELVWKLYIPAAGTAIIAVAAIIGANRIGTRRAAAVAAAYSLSERAFSEYKEKVVEKLGENKEREIRDEIAQDRVSQNPVSSNQVLIASGGEVRCYEAYTGRYFSSDMETIRKAQNDTNAHILHHGYASLSEFYERIGLPKTSVSDDVGWTSDKPMEIYFSTVLSEDGKPCISIDFVVEPVRNYYRFH